jgi:alginate O-acetyltransferase complex protein AlgI
VSVSSLEYLVALCLFTALFFRLSGRRARQFAFAIAGVGFFASHVVDPRSMLTIVVFLLSGYGCAQLLLRCPAHRLLACYLVLLVSSFAYVKQYVFLAPFISQRLIDIHLDLVGLSYMLFRQIHFLVDVLQGQIEQPSLWCYLNYQLNPFTLLAGPIERYQDFEDYWANPAPLFAERHDLLKVYVRILLGIIKIVVVAEAFRGGYDRFLTELDAPGTLSPSGWNAVAKLALMLYCFLFYLYMNFSGYCDVVIAAASLLGLRLPENFNYPFVARNILDYWSRWHITLGLWIRDYLFTPFYKAAVERFPAHGKAMAVLGYFLAFSLAGVWHGSTWNFLAYGLLHGAGASAAKFWENLIIARKGRPGLRNYLKSRTIRALAVFCTFHYACFSLLVFTLDLPHALRILTKIARSFAGGY